MEPLSDVGSPARSSFVCDGCQPARSPLRLERRLFLQSKRRNLYLDLGVQVQADPLWKAGSGCFCAAAEMVGARHTSRSNAYHLENRVLEYGQVRDHGYREPHGRRGTE